MTKREINGILYYLAIKYSRRIDWGQVFFLHSSNDFSRVMAVMTLVP